MANVEGSNCNDFLTPFIQFPRFAGETEAIGEWSRPLYHGKRCAEATVEGLDCRRSQGAKPFLIPPGQPGANGKG